MAFDDGDSKQVDFIWKVVLIGDSAVGKTGLLSKFTKNEVKWSGQATIGADFATRTVQIQGKTVKVQIWDTAGVERFRSTNSMYYRGAVGALVVYDICNDITFNNLGRWLQDLLSVADPSCSIMMVGNKTDLDEYRQISSRDGRAFAELSNYSFIETSAKCNSNVEQAFNNLFEDIHKRQKESISQSFYEKGQRLEPETESTQDTGSCCS